jgi:hypothetical protein
MLRKICGEGFVAEKLMAQNPRHKICGSVSLLRKIRETEFTLLSKEYVGLVCWLHFKSRDTRLTTTPISLPLPLISIPPSYIKFIKYCE